MRPSKEAANSKHQEFLKMFNSGKYDQKQIAVIMGVSEKTISKWANSLPEAKYLQQAKVLQKRLDTAIADPNTSIDDIWKLTNAIKRLTDLAKVQH